MTARAGARAALTMKANTVTQTFIHMTEDQFDTTYPLRRNHLVKHAPFNDCMFETFGKEHDFVRQQPPNRVWTVMDDDHGNLCISSGYHYVNRVGYLISTVPVPDHTDIVVELDKLNDDEDETEESAPATS